MPATSPLRGDCRLTDFCLRAMVVMTMLILEVAMVVMTLAILLTTAK